MYMETMTLSLSKNLCSLEGRNSVDRLIYNVEDTKILTELQKDTCHR